MGREDAIVLAVCIVPDYSVKTADRIVSAYWASSVQCRDLGKVDTNASIYATPVLPACGEQTPCHARVLNLPRQRALPELEAKDKAFPSIS